MSAPRARSSVAANRRSAHPDFAGVPWWAAIVIASITTLLGFGFSLGSHELGGVFASMYVIGCIAAVLAVQQEGIFTAIIQPPLVLFVAVPGAYYVFHGGEFTGLKDTLINYGYPLIERFPLMLFTSAAVLLIGLIRWYFAAGSRSTAAADASETGATEAQGANVFTGLAAGAKGLFNRGATVNQGTAEETEPAERPARPRRRHSVDRTATAQRRSRTPRTTERASERSETTRSEKARSESTGGTRSRHSRPPLNDDPRPRRSAPRSAAAEPRSGAAEPRERRSPERSRDPRPVREPREPRDPGQRANRAPRREPPLSRENYDRAPYEPAAYDAAPYEPSPYRPRHGGSDFSRPTSRDRSSSEHHPISQVRYRGSDDDAPVDDEIRPRRAPERPSTREPDWRYDR